MNCSFAPDPAQQRDPADIPNAAFWPALNMTTFCDQYAIDAALDNAMIRNALMIAAAATNRRLATWQSQQVAAGFSTLADDQLGGADILPQLYLAAAYNTAKADLVRRSISTGRREDAEAAAREATDLADHYQAQATAALAEIQNQSATGVWLI
ncbi:head completion/stabilization protein [Oceanobacter mangrovi]|uniref:head completion/stabilization protein n=1 Tax=Oceanobacter mangrovi TaxID=2862510 RepID=UPI001C8E8306|nr:head completion/stabilization protein [Oceanobacter mangrovi]